MLGNVLLVCFCIMLVKLNLGIIDFIMLKIVLYKVILIIWFCFVM